MPASQMAHTAQPGLIPQNLPPQIAMPYGPGQTLEGQSGPSNFTQVATFEGYAIGNQGGLPNGSIMLSQNLPGAFEGMIGPLPLPTFDTSYGELYHNVDTRAFEQLSISQPDHQSPVSQPDHQSPVSQSDNQSPVSQSDIQPLADIKPDMSAQQAVESQEVPQYMSTMPTYSSSADAFADLYVNPYHTGGHDSTDTPEVEGSSDR